MLSPGAMHQVSAAALDAEFHTPELRSLKFLGPRLAMYPDGRLLVHGQGFNSIGGVATGPLARFDAANGALDASFHFSQDYFSAFTATVGPQGEAIVNAQLSSFNGSSRNTLLRVRPDGSIDPSFNVGDSADDNIRTIVFQPDGKVLVGGLFTTFNKSTYPGIVRLNTNGSIDTSFKPVTLTTNDGSFTKTGLWAPIALQPDGKILIAGSFSSVGGRPRDGLARLKPDGTVDDSFVPTGFSVLNKLFIRGVGFQSDGRIIVGGRFQLGFNQFASPLVRLDTNGVADATFQTLFTGTGGVTRDMKVLSDDRIIVGDDKVYRFQKNGSLDTNYVHNLIVDSGGTNQSGMIFTLVVQPSGKVVVSGNFNAVGAVPRQGIARFNTDGSLDTMDLGKLRQDTFPRHLEVQQDGMILLSSDYREFNGQPSIGLDRMSAEGIRDPKFDPGAALGRNSAITDFQILDSGKILVLGRLGISSNEPSIARLNPDGTLDKTFTPATNAPVAMANAMLQPDGKILLFAGDDVQSIVQYNGANLIRRMNADGTPDATFVDTSYLNAMPFVVRDANKTLVGVYAMGPRPITVLSNGKIMVVAFSDNSAVNLVRLNTDGTLDSSFPPVTLEGGDFYPDFPPIKDPLSNKTTQVQTIRLNHNGIYDIKEMPDGRIYVAGQFRTFRDLGYPGIVRLNVDGSVDQTFGAGLGPRWVKTTEFLNFFPRIERLRIVEGGKIIAIGNFEQFHTNDFNGIVRLNTNGVVDASFIPGIHRRDFGLFAQEPGDILVLKDSSFLISGSFSALTETTARSLFRFMHRPKIQAGIVQAPPPANPGEPPPPPAISFDLKGGADSSYQIQTSTDLIHWVNVAIVSGTNNSTFQETVEAQTKGKFYRIVAIQ